MQIAINTATPETCRKIRCGEISQATAGPRLLYECSRAGYAGSMTADCGNRWATTINRQSAINPLSSPVTSPVRVDTPRVRTTPMPSITPARRKEAPSFTYTGAGCGFAYWVDHNKAAAAAMLAAGYFLLGR